MAGPSRKSSARPGARAAGASAGSARRTPAVKSGPRARKSSVPPAEEGSRRVKVVRDSFTMPVAEYERIAQLKKRSIEAGVALKKSEVLRAGLAVLAALPQTQFSEVVAAVQPVKTGRPPREKKKRKHARRGKSRKTD